MSNKLISVIVPVYKVERYLRKCVDSILIQTYENLEVLLVDDGSPDECGIICDDYAKKDSRIKVIHKDNGGLSDARNAGFEASNGEYILFIDSDDYIESDMIEYLYSNLVEANAEISSCGNFDVYESHTVTEFSGGETIVCNGEAFYSYLLRGEKVRGEIWNKLIKRSVVEDIRFPKGRLYEDIYFTADMMKNVQTAVIGTEAKYYYVHRGSSITGKPYRRQLLDIITGYEKAYQVVKNEFPALEEIANCLVLWSRFIVLDKILTQPNYKEISELPEMVLYLKKHRRDIVHNKYFHPRRKISVIILSISVNAYRQIVLLQEKKKSELKE
ncbi:glycosyltransferase involved in cell wall biosynthesis [Lachnospiraceae bacterium PF1-22]|uniref:glycosyltransferase family 2 protein n=1 Tax=Ohessyouella blattaphilus TaxID=2949333 RepID=UPI003E2ADAF3